MNEEKDIEILGETVEINQMTKETPNEEESIEMPVIEKVIVEDVEKEEKKKAKKKKISKIIIIIVFIAIILGVIAAFVVPMYLNETQKESTTQKRVISKNPYETAIRTALEDGSLAKEVTKALETNSIQAKQVELMSFDIDSDNDLELIAYAEDDTKKFILQFEVDEYVIYEDSYPVNSKESIGFVYSYSQEDVFWETESSERYTIISDTKYIVQEDIFLSEYYVITKTYKDKPILSNIVVYELNKKLNVEKLLQNKITNDMVLDSLNLSIDDIKTTALDKKKLAEQEITQKRVEELANSNSFQLNGRRLLYGTYIDSEEPIEVTTIVIERNGTAVLDGSACTWTREEHEFSGNSITAGAESLVLLCSNQKYYYTSMNDFELTNVGQSTLTYRDE